jgi:sulfur carrier protein
MTITVAGTKKEYEDGLTVDKLVTLENVEMPDYVTVTINDNIIEHDDFAGTELKTGDSVEFLYFMGGGC